MPHSSKHRVTWTPEDIQMLTEMRKAGKTAKAIAEALGPSFTKRRVEDKASRLGVLAPVMNDWPQERVARMTALWLEGLTATQVAAKMDDGATRASVLGKLDRLNLLKIERTTLSRNPPKPKRQILVKAKRVTLPPLPINRPDIIADGGPGRPGAWLALEGTTPIPLHMLGDAPREGHANTCRWPIGENPTLFCGCATEKTYCAAHAKVAYRPLPEKATK